MVAELVRGPRDQVGWYGCFFLNEQSCKQNGEERGEVRASQVLDHFRDHTGWLGKHIDPVQSTVSQVGS